MKKLYVRAALMDAFVDWVLDPMFRAWDWIKFHTTRRWHVLDLRHRDYEYGWMDVDELMVVALFKLLERYVEEEDGLTELFGSAQTTLECGFPERAQELFALYDEIRVLYTWWLYDRGNENLSMIEAHKKDTEMAMRLLQIREYLWT